MYIMSENEREIVNSDFVERFCLSEKPDAALIVASYCSDRPPVTLARYRDVDEARSALMDMIQALSAGVTMYRMPDSSYDAPEQTSAATRGARTKRRGGS